jgi:hypothetical protein
MWGSRIQYCQSVVSVGEHEKEIDRVVEFHDTRVPIGIECDSKLTKD